MPTNKKLGQHWLRDRGVLEDIAAEGQLSSSDTVLEVGPGLGTLTSVLLAGAGTVIAVEYDAELARKLPGQFPGKNLEVVHADFLDFDLDLLPTDYKIVANIPYFISTKIIKKLVLTDTKPSVAVLLVQREVAEKLAGARGRYTELGVLAASFYDLSVGRDVARDFFSPPPEVDSAVLVLRRRETVIVNHAHYAEFRRVVHGGFSAPRKKVSHNLAQLFPVSRLRVEKALESLGLAPGVRAEALDVSQWDQLSRILTEASRPNLTESS